MTAYAIDPGKRACGFAEFYENGELAQASFVRAKDQDSVVAAVREEIANNPAPTLVIEFPRVYPLRQQKGDPNDLMELAYVVGGISSFPFWGKRVRYYPRDWKGTVDPDVMTGRIRRCLSSAEQSDIESPGAALEHNVFDAIGIGLYYFGRLNQQPIIRRGNAKT